MLARQQIAVGLHPHKLSHYLTATCSQWSTAWPTPKEKHTRAMLSTMLGAGPR